MTDRISALVLFLVLSGTPALASAQDTTDTTSGGSAGTSDGWGSSGTTEGFVAPGAPGSETGAGLMARQFYFGIGLGFDAPFNGRGALFALEEDAGIRFFGFNIGNELDGAIFAGLSLGQSFGDQFAGLQFDLRGGADFEVFDNGEIQLLATPSITAGGGLIIVSNIPTVTGGTTSSTVGFFDLGFHAQAELVLADGLVGVWLRPLSFEIFIGDGSYGQYELLAGVNFRL